jgi:hypothetical protein
VIELLPPVAVTNLVFQSATTAEAELVPYALMKPFGTWNIGGATGTFVAAKTIAELIYAHNINKVIEILDMVLKYLLLARQSTKNKMSG